MLSQPPSRLSVSARASRVWWRCASRARGGQDVRRRGPRAAGNQLVTSASQTPPRPSVVTVLADGLPRLTDESVGATT